MADFVIEQADGRLTSADITGKTVTQMTYLVIMESPDADEQAAFNALINPAAVPNICPAVYDGQRRTKVALVERISRGRFKFQVDFELADSDKSDDDQKAVDEWTVSFSTTGAQAHRTRSLGTKFFSQAGRVAANDDYFLNGIGVRADDENVGFDGVDIIVPQLRFNIDVKLSQTTLKMSYINKVKTLTGKTNNASFPPQSGGFYDDSFAAGEVLCEGIEGSSRLAGDSTISIAFSVSENKPNLQVAPGITVAKDGWEYVWLWDEKAVLAMAEINKKYVIPVPKYAMVEKVYESADFSILGLS
jgi:hypothetical protein